ncbi:hypothetical protein J1N35_037433 [Gossypium stocksii]|uniref:Uncharacterized protein n=1 Tax=Gossypium stocksii TaxID=47602 RepID=A0A9D3UM01_9ROSI|nr:hypothetical protein J1N35_037433 [Gossypium stocksii]
MKMKMTKVLSRIFQLRSMFLHRLLILLPINVAFFDALHSLINDLLGFKDDVNSRLSSLEMQMTSLLSHFPSTPPSSSHDDDWDRTLLLHLYTTFHNI